MTLELYKQVLKELEDAKKPKLKIHTCKRCGHEWASKINNPKVCPNQKCHSAYWNVKRLRK